MSLPAIFTDPDAARKHLEAQVWPRGPVCPHCGNADPERIRKMEGKAHRPGLYQCNEHECREQFTVTVGSVFERSKIPLHTWLYATHLMNSSKKGFSAHQMHRMLGVTYKTAWFMAHRIREAMRDDKASPMGGPGKIVEADETYFGSKEKVTKRTKRGKPGLASKRAVVGLVERGGRVRTFHPERADKASVRNIVVTNIDRESRLQTDESWLYHAVGKEFASHETVMHTAHEYVRGDVYTNTIEGYFSIFKRGMKGVYQHCGEKHLHRYLAEFDFRYNHRIKLGFSDAMRADIALSQIGGKRLTYRRPDKAPIPDAESPPF
jgi:transposase-like protein